MPKFVFRKHVNIGSADALEDRMFLSQSFMDNGELEILSNTSDPRAVIVGRTGAGKTALLKMLAEREERVIEVAPESLALTYLSDNTILRFFFEAGVNLDLFYRLLWRHIFIVEIVKMHYNITNENKRNDFLTEIFNLLRNNKPKQEAISYLDEWGKSFWQETDYRVKEITSTLVTELKNAVSGKAGLPVITDPSMQLSHEQTKSLTEQQRADIVQIGQPVVNKVQIARLSDVIKVLEEDVLNDRKKKYYITIDRLDENWVDDELRYQLIRALLEALRDVNNMLSGVKIIVSLREDLLDRVFKYTRASGYQEEKYKSLFLNITWKEGQLEELLDKRINQLIKQQYTNDEIQLRQLLPNNIHLNNERIDSVKYILQRTLLRPRDAILFLNECIKTAEGSTQITKRLSEKQNGAVNLRNEYKTLCK